MPAEQDLLNQLNQSASVTENGPDWLRLIISLLLVLGFAVFVLRQLKPWLQSQKTLSLVEPGKRVVVHHAARLGGGNTLHTVSVGEKTWLVATGPGGSPRLIAPVNSDNV